MWIRHHLRLGVSVVHIYDSDGSFWEPLEHWIQTGRVIYEPCGQRHLQPARQEWI